MQKCFGKKNKNTNRFKCILSLLKETMLHVSQCGVGLRVVCPPLPHSHKHVFFHKELIQFTQAVQRLLTKMKHQTLT